MTDWLLAALWCAVIGLLGGCGASDRVRTLNAVDVAADRLQKELDTRYDADFEACYPLGTYPAIAKCHEDVRGRHMTVRSAYKALSLAWVAAARLHLAAEAGEPVDADELSAAVAATLAAQAALRDAVRELGDN